TDKTPGTTNTGTSVGQKPLLTSVTAAKRVREVTPVPKPADPTPRSDPGNTSTRSLPTPSSDAVPQEAATQSDEVLYLAGESAARDVSSQTAGTTFTPTSPPDTAPVPLVADTLA